MSLKLFILPEETICYLLNSFFRQDCYDKKEVKLSIRLYLRNTSYK